MPPRLEIRVDGMSCEACAQRLAKALKGLEGVISVEVSLKPARALLELAPERIAEVRVEVERTIESLGYRVVR